MSVVDRENIDKQLKELSLLNKDLANPDNANKLKQIAIADYLLIVTVDSFNASTTTKTLELTGEKVTKGSANMEMSYKLIETATMDIVASGSDSTDMSLGAGAGCSSVVTSMTKKLSKSLSEDLLNQLK
jgi:G3E family GTPase